MALNLDRFEQLASRFPIRDRDNGNTVPFVFTPSQQHIQREIKAHRKPDMPLQAILYKSRRTGGSTWAVALLTAHCLSKPGAKAAIVAQLDTTAKELFDERAVPFAEALRTHLGEERVKITKSEIKFIWPDGRFSRLYRRTAKTVIGGRGLTASAVLLSEASFYPGEESFVSILNALSKDPDNIIIIETTANGIEGPGEVFYNYWNAAVEGVNGFIPIFMPPYEDPGFSLPASMADDAPKDDYERWMMKEFKVSRGFIAWYRWTMENKCAGSHDKMKAENPMTPEEGFIATGTPAFDTEEMSIARRSVKQPLAHGTIRTEDGETKFHKSSPGPLLIWEYPQRGQQYYMGVDAAKGVGTGDFASISIFNGDTGRKAARFSERVKPETTAYFVNALGRWYNNAMVNIEFTGGWGYVIAKELRDVYFYPTQYLWRSRDEGIEAKPRKSMGWETTDRTRRMLIDLYRVALRRGAIAVCDTVVVQQMSRCSMEIGWRWCVIKGHDDVLMSDFLAWVCVEQYHVPTLTRKGNTLDNTSRLMTDIPPDATSSTVKWANDPFSTDVGCLVMEGKRHLEKLDLAVKEAGKPKRLEGV